MPVALLVVGMVGRLGVLIRCGIVLRAWRWQFRSDGLRRLALVCVDGVDRPSAGLRLNFWCVHRMLLSNSGCWSQQSAYPLSPGVDTDQHGTSISAWGKRSSRHADLRWTRLTTRPLSNRTVRDLLRAGCMATRGTPVRQPRCDALLGILSNAEPRLCCSTVPITALGVEREIAQGQEVSRRGQRGQPVPRKCPGRLATVKAE